MNQNGRDEGYVKFHCDFEPGPSPDPSVIHQLNRWRDKLYDLKLVGAYPDGTGYGNLSLRSGGGNRFVITGTATGSLQSLSDEHYTEVTEFDIPQNHLTCRGPIRASSESMTHGSLYLLDAGIRAVIHVHHEALWKGLLNQVPSTRSSVAYGTPAMAGEMARLYGASDLPNKRIAVMGGHREGVITFGETLDAAGDLLMHYYSALPASDR